MASSNTEIYEETDYQDIEICEEESREAVIKTGENDLAALDAVPFEFPSIAKLDKSDETEGRIFHQLALTSSDCSTLVDQFQDNSPHVQISTHPETLKSNHFQAEHNHSRNAFKMPSDNLWDQIVQESNVSMIKESRILNDTKTNSNHSSVNDDSLKYGNIKRTSIGTGIVYEDELSSPDISQSSTATKTLLSSDRSSEEAKDVPSSSSLFGISSQGTSSLVFPKLPPVSTLIDDDRDVIAARDIRRISYWFSDKAYNCKDAVYLYPRENPFFCPPCGVHFKVKSDFCSHKLTHSEENPFPCNICNTSFKTRDNFISHCKVHEEEALRKSAICNICKKVFRHGSTLKLHAMSHSVEKSLEEEHDVFSSGRSQCSARTTQTLLSSDHSVAAKSVQTSLALQVNNDHGSSATIGSHTESMVTSRMPPDSNLLTNRGLLYTKDKENPFACGYCGKACKKKHTVYNHISMTRNITLVSFAVNVMHGSVICRHT